MRIQDNTGLSTGFPRIFFYDHGDRRKLLTIEQWGTGKWTSMNKAFFGCENLAEQASDSPDLSAVTDLSFMFTYANAFKQDISSWNTANVTDMNFMFTYANAFNQDIGGWDTTNVTNMSVMFRSASALIQDICEWGTDRKSHRYDLPPRRDCDLLRRQSETGDGHRQPGRAERDHHL